MAGLSNKTQTGTEALTTLQRLLGDDISARRLCEKLYTAGYIVVPLPYRKPARRGNTPKPYTGPAMIGMSHTAKLVG